MKKTIFYADRWVKFIFNKEICLGITYHHDGPDLEEPLYQLVFLITKERKTKVINFSQCMELRYLEFIRKPEQSKELKIQNEELTLASLIDLFISPDIKRKTITTLAQNQCKNIFKN